MVKTQNMHESHRRKQVTGYLLIGLVAFAIEYLSFAAIITFLPFIALAQSVSFGLGLAVSFTGNRHYTFKRKQEASEYTFDAKNQIARYLALALFNLIFTNIFIYWQVEVLGVDPLIAKVLTMAMVVMWNFVIFNKVIFRRK